MRVLIEAHMPNEPFNTCVKDGSAPGKINRILEEIRPEAAYFTEVEGKRTALLVCDLADASKIPALAEPWFLAFNADVRFRVCMNSDDLRKSGLDQLGKKWTK